MAHILGLVGSARSWGNSELLVRQTLLGAQAEGATVQMLRLTDLHLEPCTGCMRCAIGGKPCPLKDDMAWLIQRIEAADGLVLAAPTYFLGPAAVVKQVLDRLLMVTGRVTEALPGPRPAVTIATAGLQDWRGIALPFLNAVVAVLGYVPIESLTAFAPGPGEVLLSEELMSQVLTAGHRLGRGEMEPSPAPPDTCPICRCDAFVLSGHKAICPICGQEAMVELVNDELVLRFKVVERAVHRWTPEGMRKHMIEWVQATGPRFLAHRAEIKERRRPYQERELGWLCPPPARDQEEP
ncbi:MAG: flavodoxin family protein [Anaerolineae bacterium]